MINRELMALGLTYEKEIGKECYNKKFMPEKYRTYSGEGSINFYINSPGRPIPQLGNSAVISNFHMHFDTNSKSELLFFISANETVSDKALVNFTNSLIRF